MHTRYAEPASTSAHAPSYVKRKIELSNPDQQMEMSLVHSPPEFQPTLDVLAHISPRLQPVSSSTDERGRAKELTLNLEVLKRSTKYLKMTENGLRPAITVDAHAGGGPVKALSPQPVQGRMSSIAEDPNKSKRSKDADTKRFGPLQAPAESMAAVRASPRVEVVPGGGPASPAGRNQVIYSSVRDGAPDSFASDRKVYPSTAKMQRERDHPMRDDENAINFSNQVISLANSLSA